ncbi:MAG: RNA 2',3'-cyclic phosphodiesterase [Planctomycetes bacterium]|nr:RNA 2',3'-cyclic phosphodiesterase [Planctomycetota bacterium]
MPTHLRAFFAVPLDVALRPALARATEALGRVPGAKLTPVPPGNVHLTLCFLGDVPVNDVPDLVAAARSGLAGAGPFDARLAGVGAFPSPERPRVIFVGVPDAAGGVFIAALADRLLNALRPVARLKREKSFTAHATIARVKVAAPALGAFLNDWRATEFGLTRVREVTLFQSELRPGGPLYSPLATLPLG